MGERFVMVFRGEDREDGPSVCVASESLVSSTVDFSDCNGEPFDIYYVADEGKIEPVTRGPRFRINEDEERPFEFEAADMIIRPDAEGRGEVVGRLVFTDH